MPLDTVNITCRAVFVVLNNLVRNRLLSDFTAQSSIPEDSFPRVLRLIDERCGSLDMLSSFQSGFSLDRGYKGRFVLLVTLLLNSACGTGGVLSIF